MGTSSSANSRPCPICSIFIGMLAPFRTLAPPLQTEGEGEIRAATGQEVGGVGVMVTVLRKGGGQRQAAVEKAFIAERGRDSRAVSEGVARANGQRVAIHLPEKTVPPVR